MIIKYIHSEEPEIEKTYDTEKALKNNPFIHLSQKEFDTLEMEHFAKDENNGIILSYEVLK